MSTRRRKDRLYKFEQRPSATSRLLLCNGHDFRLSKRTLQPRAKELENRDVHYNRAGTPIIEFVWFN